MTTPAASEVPDQVVRWFIDALRKAAREYGYDVVDLTAEPDDEDTEDT